MPHGGRLSKNADCTQRRRHQDDAGKRRVYPPGQQNDRGKRWHCKEIQQLGGTQGTVPCVLYAIDVKEDEGGRTEREGLKEWIHEILK